jgi:hypothetical protein
MRQRGSGQRYEGGIGGVKGGGDMVVIRVEGVYIDVPNSRWVSLVKLSDEIWGMNIASWFP